LTRDPEGTLYPKQDEPKSSEAQLTLLSQILPKLREVFISKSLTLPTAFALFDPEKLGLIPYPTFSKVLDSLLKVSNKGKEELFKKMDSPLRIGMINYE